MIDALILASAACMPTAEMHGELAERYSENRVIAALSRGGDIVEIWAAPSGSWTAIVTRPDGMSCVVDAGHGITAYAIEPAGDPA